IIAPPAASATRLAPCAQTSAQCSFTNRPGQTRRQAMTPETFWIIKIIFGTCAGLFGLLATFFTFYDTFKDDKHDDTRAWFKAKWEAIKDSPWLTLPERAIYWFLDVPFFLKKYNKEMRSKLGSFMLVGLIILSVIGCCIAFGLFLAVLPLVINAPLFIIALLKLIKKDSIETQWLQDILLIWLMLGLVGTGGIVMICWMFIVLGLNIYYAAPAMLLIFPFYWYGMLIGVGLSLANAAIWREKDSA